MDNLVAAIEAGRAVRHGTRIAYRDGVYALQSVRNGRVIETYKRTSRAETAAAWADFSARRVG